MNNNFSLKIETARETYSIKFLNEQFENKDDNKIRKDKLHKLLENSNDTKQIKNRCKPKI